MATIATLTPIPRRRSTAPTPSPWAVDLATGKVLPQNPWEDDPMQLIGFASDDSTREVEVIRPEFTEEPLRAEGMHPIFVGKGGRLWTSKYRVQIGLASAQDELPAPVPAAAHASH